MAYAAAQIEKEHYRLSSDEASTTSTITSVPSRNPGRKAVVDTDDMKTSRTTSGDSSRPADRPAGCGGGGGGGDGGDNGDGRATYQS